MSKTIPDPYSPELGDWRTLYATWVTEMGGTELNEPFGIMHACIHIAGTELWSFTAPSAAALHLNSAWKAARRANELLPRVRWTDVHTPGGLQHNIVNEQTCLLFDLLEEQITAVMSSYAAVEAFCNGLIVTKQTAPKKVRRRKSETTMTAEEIERFESTEEKLKRHLPDILGVPTPANKAVWARFRLLQDLRDAVTHFKRRDQVRLAHAASEPTALHKLLNTDPFALPEAAMELVSYFVCPSAPLERWMRNPEWRRTDVC